MTDAGGSRFLPFRSGVSLTQPSVDPNLNTNPLRPASGSGIMKAERKPGPLSICTKQEIEMEHIGQKIKDLRKEADMTQERFMAGRHALPAFFMILSVIRDGRRKTGS